MKERITTKMRLEAMFKLKIKCKNMIKNGEK